jgi:alkylation response protein AidB-like acyl-CoA dehydrogenase
MMDLEPSPSERAFRDEARRWLETNLPPAALGSGDTAEGFARCRAWERQLFAAGWAVPMWPREYGGRECTLVEWLLFEEEYWRLGAPQRVSQNGISLLAPTLFHFGSDEQKRRFLQRMAAVDDVWAQGWSEPNAGSDLAALASKATRDDKRGGWRLSGQKTWCTRGAFCDWLFGLFRSDPNAERHKGLTYFLVPLTAEGVTVRPVCRLDGEPGFAEVFFDDAFVPDRDVLGEVHKGWDVAMATAGSERGLNLRSPGRFLATAERLVALYRATVRRQGHQGHPGNQGQVNSGGDFHADPTRTRDQLARAWIDAQAYRLYTLQTATRLADGGTIGSEQSLNKIFWSELDVRLHQTALELLGPLGELAGGDEAIDGGAWIKGFQFALAGPIYAGTNEIQRNVVAERVLGLPRR